MLAGGEIEDQGPQESPQEEGYLILVKESLLQGGGLGRGQAETNLFPEEMPVHLLVRNCNNLLTLQQSLQNKQSQGLT